MSSDAARRAGAILEIDLGTIVANWRLLAEVSAPAQCAAVVKANAYGLGVIPVARALATAGCHMFFVASLDEGVGLRQALGANPEIAVLNGPPPQCAAQFIEHGLIPVLNHSGQIAEWEKVIEIVGVPPVPCKKTGGHDAGTPIGSAILHVDTGMARLGLTAQEFAALVERRPRIAWRAVMSHLACADEPHHELNERQRARFTAAAAHFPGVPACLAASSGIFLGSQYCFDLVRPGAALYGVNPRPGRCNPMSPVVRLSAKILQIRQIDRGKTVGYGAAHTMQGAGRVATVGVGYADGWLRSFSQRGCGFIAGMRVPLIGRVSMDLATFDVSAVPEANLQSDATIELLGPEYGVDEAALDAGTIGYEILTALGTRYRRVYRNAPDETLAA